MRRIILVPDVDGGESMRDLLVDVQTVTGQTAGVAFGGVVVSPETARTYLTHTLGESAPEPSAPGGDSAGDGADPTPPAPTRRTAKKTAATKTTPAGRTRTAQRSGE